VLARGGGCLELAAGDDHQLAADQAHLATELHEGPTARLKDLAVALRKSAMVLKSGATENKLPWLRASPWMQCINKNTRISRYGYFLIRHSGC
jgi:hypothetical protein